MYDVAFAGLASAGVETLKTVLLWPDTSPRNASSSIFEFTFRECQNYARTCQQLYLSVQLQLPLSIRDGYELIVDHGFAESVLCTAELRIGGKLIQTLYGDQLHMQSEFEDTTLKRHRRNRRTGISIADAIRQPGGPGQGRRYYTELPFFFTVPPAHGMNLNNLCKAELRVRLRPMRELARYVRTTGSTGSLNLEYHWGQEQYAQVKVLAVSRVDGLGNVDVPLPEKFQTVARIAEPIHDELSMRTLFPRGAKGDSLRLPINRYSGKMSHIMWATREVVDAALFNTGSDGGVSGGIKTLWGNTLCKDPTDSTHNPGPGFPVGPRHDFNSQRTGMKHLGTFAKHLRSRRNTVLDYMTSEVYNISPPVLRSHGDVRTYRSDGLMGSLAFPGDRHEYRACDADGNEIEPIAKMQYLIDGVRQIDNDVKGMKFRLMEARRHATAFPRKGIYLYSFAMAPFSGNHAGHLSHAPNSVHEIELTHANIHAPTELIMYAVHYVLITVDGSSVCSSRPLNN